MTLSNTNITYDSTFATFSRTHIFFLTFDVTIFNYAMPKSYVTVLLSCLEVQFFFLTNDGFIVILGNTNITFDHTFFTFGYTLISSHI